MTDREHLSQFCERCALSDAAFHVNRSTLQWQGGSAVSGGATGLHFLMVSLWKAETELGLLTARNGGGWGCLVGLRVHNDGSCLFHECLTHTHTHTA